MSKRPSDKIRLQLVKEINEAFESFEPYAICAAIGRAVREHNVAELARRTGLSRASIYRAFGGQQSPNFSTVLCVLKAMEMNLEVNIRKRRTSHG